MKYTIEIDENYLTIKMGVNDVNAQKIMALIGLPPKPVNPVMECRINPVRLLSALNDQNNHINRNVFDIRYENLTNSARYMSVYVTPERQIKVDFREVCTVGSNLTVLPLLIDRVQRQTGLVFCADGVQRFIETAGIL